MDCQSSRLKFAVIGHQDSWQKVTAFVNAVRSPGHMNRLTVEELKDVYTYIPPRELFEVNVCSKKTGMVNGVYIETFISPDHLDLQHLRSNLVKVKEACRCAASLNIPIVSLGGFTSIILESGGLDLSRIGSSCFTTGNTLTAAFIVKSVEKACMRWNLSLRKAKLMIIGSTGDIGSACTNYFAGKTSELICCARQKGRLEQQALSLLAKQINVNWSTDVNEFITSADIVISVASSMIDPTVTLNISPHTIICDAGYPKNLSEKLHASHERIFCGGMGIVENGYVFDPDYTSQVYSFPYRNIAHGCVLESIVLAMDDRPFSLSYGRGNITPTAMIDILEVAATHGILPAPLFNSGAVCDDFKPKKYHHETI